MTPDSSFVSKNIRIAAVRYLELEEQERRLLAEKRALRKHLAQCLRQLHTVGLQLTIGKDHVVVIDRSHTRIQYNERVLRQRLGDRYSAILSVDFKKLKGQRQLLQNLLIAHLTNLGSPHSRKVNEAVSKGIVRVAEFSGAFTKESIQTAKVYRQPNAPTTTSLLGLERPEAVPPEDHENLDAPEEAAVDPFEDNEVYMEDYEDEEEELLLQEALEYEDDMARADEAGWFYDDDDDELEDGGTDDDGFADDSDE